MDGIEFISSVVALSGVPLILGLVQIFKPFVKDTRLYPVLAVAFGLAINLVAGLALGIDWASTIFNGIIAGLAAGGLYSAGSTINEGASADKRHPSHEGESHETE